MYTCIIYIQYSMLCLPSYSAVCIYLDATAVLFIKIGQGVFHCISMNHLSEPVLFLRRKNMMLNKLTGATELILTPWFAHSIASDFVRFSTPALAAPVWLKTNTWLRRFHNFQRISKIYQTSLHLKPKVILVYCTTDILEFF